MIRRMTAAVLLLVLLGGCAAETIGGPKRYEATFLDVFDTVTTVVGYADSEAEFTAAAQSIRDSLLEYHQLYDIYNDYPGLVNLKTVNDSAGTAPVPVDERIMGLLKLCCSLYGATDGRVNVAMGSVLRLWHDARKAGIDDPEHAVLPEGTAVEAAMGHMDLSCLVLDEEAGTVYLADGEMSLDVGAVAKGYAVEQVCRSAPAGFLVSVGGNVRATGPKADGSPWVVGIESPDGGDFLHTLYLQEGSLVTSGDYQRYYTVDGVRYHHIIEPDTGYPASHWRSVTVVLEDSALADGLSTALFTLDLERGLAMAEDFGAEAMWVDGDGNRFYSPGFEEKIRT